MPEPFLRRGEWWTERPDGVWLRWNEAGGMWEEQSSPPPPPGPGDPGHPWSGAYPVTGYPQPAAAYGRPVAAQPYAYPQPHPTHGYAAAPSSVAAQQAPAGGPSPGAVEDSPITRSNAAGPPVYNAGAWWVRRLDGVIFTHEPATNRWVAWDPDVPGPIPPVFLGGFASAQPYAGFWERLGACLLDLLVVGTVWLVLAIPFAIWAENSSPNPLPAVLTWIAGFLVWWLYHAVMESSSRGGTLGKMAARITVRDMEGERVSFLRATVRTFAKFLSLGTLGFGYLMAAFTDKRQALHDLVARCVVTRRGTAADER